MKRLLWIGLLVLCACGLKPQVVTITMETNPSTGYEWVVTQEPELFSVETKEEKVEEGQVGTAHDIIYTLTPKEQGTTQVQFVYQRDWEEEPISEITYWFEVDEDKQVSLTKTEKSGEQSEKGVTVVIE